MNFLKKRVLGLALATMTLAGQASAQCTLPGYTAPPLGMKLYVSNLNDFIYNGPGGAANLMEVYAEKCGTNTINFELQYNAVNNDQIFRLEVFREYFDCNGNGQGWNSFMFLPDDYVPNGQIGISNFSAPSEENVHYKVRITRKTRILGDWWSGWGSEEWTNNVRFTTIGEAPNTVATYPNSSGTVGHFSSSTGWTADVEQLCATDDVIIDGSASSCEDNHLFIVAEFDVNSWTSNEIFNSGWRSGAVGTINLDNEGVQFQHGQVYILTLVTGNNHTGWVPSYTFFEYKAPSGTTSLTSSSTLWEQVFFPGGSSWYQLHEFCYPGASRLDANISCDDGYSLKIQEVNSSYAVGNTVYNSGQVSGQVPSYFNFHSLIPSAGSPGWQPAYGQRYRVTLSVDGMNNDVVYHFRYKSCPIIINPKSTQADLNVIPTAAELTAYPNPANSETTISSTQNLGVVRVLDLQGKVVLDQYFDAKQGTLNIQSLSPGVYLVKSNSSTVKLIKK